MSEFVYPLFGIPAIYVDPLVVTFRVTPPVAELGDSVPSVALNWELTKTPLHLELDGATLHPNTQLIAVTGPFTTLTSWKLKMSDELGSDSKKATLLFQNKFYWQNLASPPTDSAGILAMENSFFADKYARTLQVGTPGDLLPCLAYPKRFASPRKILIGTPNPAVAALRVLWTQYTDFTVATVPFTNASGYIEDYLVVSFNTAVVFNTAPENSSLLVQLI